MQQLSLFDPPKTSEAHRGLLDAEAEIWLECFASVRLGEGASRRSVLRERSQLRAIVRACGGPGTPTTLATICSDLPSVARALLEPPVPISRATGRARLVAVQRFLRVMGPRRLGRRLGAANVRGGRSGGSPPPPGERTRNTQAGSPRRRRAIRDGLRTSPAGQTETVAASAHSSPPWDPASPSSRPPSLSQITDSRGRT